MRNALLCTAAACLAGLVPIAAEAAILNGGFENGFTAWDTIGDYKVETSTFGSGSIEGTSQAFLSTASSNEFPSGNAAPVTFISGVNSLEGFLGLSTFLGDKSLDSLATAQPIEGSAIKQTFTASAGQKLSFSWNFLTDESVEQAARNDFTYPDFNDFSFVTIQSDSSQELQSLADTTSNFRDSSTPFFNETGFRTFSYTIPTTGNYTLGIGVVDVGERTRISGLLVDQAVVVPETTPIIGLLFLGSLGAFSLIGRSQRRSLSLLESRLSRWVVSKE